jgi:hypothetical protein
LYDGWYKAFKTKTRAFRVELGLETRETTHEGKVEEPKMRTFDRGGASHCEGAKTNHLLTSIGIQDELVPYPYTVLESGQDALQNDRQHLRQVFAGNLNCIGKSEQSPMDYSSLELEHFVLRYPLISQTKVIISID